MTVRALILAGGSGTRLWPLSTDERPKPFLPLAGPRSLLRETFDRAARLFFIGDQNILAIQKQDAELLGLKMRHGGVAIVEQRVP